jgi:hypothetical protein
MNRRRILALLLAAKLLAGAAAWYVVGAFTKLGDTQDYLAGAHLDRENALSTTYLMSFSGHAFSAVLGYGFMANVPTLLMAWYGLVKSTKLLELDTGRWSLLLVMLLSPTFLLWTSIHSKEAVVNFCAGFVTYAIVARFKNLALDLWNTTLAVVAFVALVWIKPGYAPAFGWLLCFAVIGPVTRHPRALSISITLFVGALGVVLTGYFFDLLDELIPLFHRHFSAQGTLTRVGWGWSGVADFLTEMPVGIVVSFIGPTPAEVMESPLLLPFFLEGLLTLVAVAYMLVRATVRNGQLVVSRFVMLSGFVLLLLIAQYPFGYFNAGSAMRYRQAFYPALVVVLAAFAFDWRLSLQSLRATPSKGYVLRSRTVGEVWN